MKKKNQWYKEGIQFECQGSGRCCSSRGQYGYVYMTLEDRKNMAKALKMTTSGFTRKYCAKTDGVYHLVENRFEDDTLNPDCIFLKNNKCSVYQGRPIQCRTWPFWPEVMKPKAWRKEVVKFCPGVNKGRVHSQKEIEKNLELQKASEQELFGEAFLG